MDKQETIKNKSIEAILPFYNKYFNFILNVIWGIIMIFTVICVIGLLWVNDFTGASILLFKLVRIFLMTTVIGTVIWAYIWFFINLLKKSNERRKRNKAEFFKEVRLIIKEEVKNGRRSRSTK